MPRTGSCFACRDSFIWYMVCSSQNSFPHCLQFTGVCPPPMAICDDIGRLQTGSEHTSRYPWRCQCARVTSSSGSLRMGAGSWCTCVVELLAEWATEGGGEGWSFDSNTSRPLSFWFRTARGWNFFALRICDSNQFLTSSCSSSTRFWWSSSRCLIWSDGV